MPIVQPFMIRIQLQSKEYNLRVTQLHCSEFLETYRVEARNHTIIVSCNRPEMMEAGIVHLPWKWDALNPPPKSGIFVKEIQLEVQRHIKSLAQQDIRSSRNR